jgi:hypothetical protein
LHCPLLRCRCLFSQCGDKIISKEDLWQDR